MTNFKIGVVGFGYWGKNQARVFKELGALKGIYEKNPDLIEDHENEYFFFDTLEAMLKEVDGVVICTPAETHFEIACTALEKSVDILVEKPIAMNLSQVKKIIEIEKRKKRIVMVGHQLHFHPAIKKMKELIKDGEIGDIKWIYSNRLNLGKIRPYENVLWSFAPHDISLILEFINDEIESIDVQATKILNNNIEDTTLTLLNFKKNIKAHIFVSWIHPFKEQRFVIVGSNGSLVFSDTEEVNKLKLFKTTILNDGNIEKHSLTNIELASLEPLKEQAEYFLECIEKRKINLNDSQHAYNVVSVLEESTKRIKEKSNNG
jgi:UDP-2-acetamido-3-amino-2,3-dideoxy-glucuronate N-acetyltransferase